jgi:hypothetical protein
MTRVGPVQIVSTRTFGKLCDRNECRFGPFSLVAISLQRDGANDVVEFGLHVDERQMGFGFVGEKYGMEHPPIDPAGNREGGDVSVALQSDRAP